MGLDRVRKADGNAIASLVLGIIGLTVFPVVPSIPAFVLGRDAKRRIKASGGELNGYELAQAGWEIGIFGIVLGVLGVLAFLMIIAEGIRSGGEL